MAEYYYDVHDEVFKRTDNRGNHLAVNVAEAQRIESLINLGYSEYKIQDKVVLSNPKASRSTINSFIKNLKAGNIHMPEDAPAPILMFDSLTDSERIDALEERISKLEEWIKDNNVISENTEKSLTNKVKSWIR